MKNNPTGAMGVRDYLGWNWKSKAGIPIVNIPGCPAQPDNMTETLVHLVFALAGMGAGARARRGRPARCRSSAAPRTRAATAPRSTRRATSPRSTAPTTAAWSSSAARARWSSATCRCAAGQSHMGGCPNVGGICMACTMPGFPDKYMPFMDEDPMGEVSSNIAKFTLRPAPALGPPREHQAQVRQGAGVEAQPRGAHDRLPEALVRSAHGDRREPRRSRRSPSRRCRGTP